ncbi:AraC family transcriptional regulator [Flammeovirga sp. EKP202]|uniref:helix-turn-helix domain-containing protein n=1 Tax=Flammeovirga sp. EKP202 TaxID=2770592 RepID=UPI00165F2578|nr:helix-turn-helix transcriptional regulator [Flammeovirga sp. EKP202]
MKNQLITYKKNRIIFSHERKNKAIIDIYPSQHLLTYIREGILKVKQGKEVQCFSKGEFVLFKKHTQATITKTWGKGEIKFSSIVFSFHEDLIQEIFTQLNIQSPKKSKKSFENILGVISNPVLNQFIQSLDLFLNEGVEMDNQLARLKTTEAIIGLIRTNNELSYQLQNFSVKSKADLHQYMNFHFLENKKLVDFAKETGRSISVFKKDFQAIYDTTPAKWLKKKRLDYAYKLLTTTNRKASEIYLECGFEDLAHFSKSFKSQFQINPSQIKTLQTSK